MKPSDAISLDAVREEPVAFAFEVAFSAREFDREPLLEISPARIAGEVSRIEKGFAFDAHLDYAGRLECSRCLTAYPFRNSEDFSLVLRRRPAPGTGEVALQSEDEYFYDDELLSVAPIAEERIQMAIPMKPLCREDCRGLCPQCGQDLNVTACGCVVETEDPRWEALRVLKKV